MLISWAARNLRRFSWASTLLTLSAVHACPLCHTETGKQVRAGILSDNFGLNLVAIALPFPVFAAIVAYIYFGNRRAPESSGEHKP